MDPQESINPFGALPTAPPTVVPSEETAISIEPEIKIKWKRISSRQWARNVRDCAAKFYAAPYQTVFNSWFWTTGTYTDMIDEENYTKYTTKAAVGVVVGRESIFSEGPTTTDTSRTTSAYPSSTSDSNVNVRGDKKKHSKSSGKQVEIADDLKTPSLLARLMGEKGKRRGSQFGTESESVFSDDTSRHSRKSRKRKTRKEKGEHSHPEHLED